jgi:hypothetical protein
MTKLIPAEIIERKNYLLRGQKVMLSTDLAELYAVEPKALIQTVKRNVERFPEDFTFMLSNQEFANLKSQIVTSSWGGIRRAELSRKLDAREKKYDSQFRMVFDAIRQLMTQPDKKMKVIRGFGQKKDV